MRRLIAFIGLLLLIFCFSPGTSSASFAHRGNTWGDSVEEVESRENISQISHATINDTYITEYYAGTFDLHASPPGMAASL